MHTYRHDSGLLVAEQAVDERAIGNALARLDDRLFLSWEIDRRHKLVCYRVMCEYAAGNVAPLLEWRDDSGVPLPLSSGLLEKVKSLRPRDGQDYDYEAANARLRDQAIRDFDEAADEIAADIGPRISEKRTALLHRGVHLRRSRHRRENG